MHTKFNIYHYLSSLTIARDLDIRLNRSGKVADFHQLKQEEVPPLPESQEDDPIQVILLTKGDDVAAVKKWKIPEIVIQQHGAVVVGVSLIKEEIPGLGALDYIGIDDNVEQIRRELQQFYYRNRRGGESYSWFVGRTQDLEQFQNILFSERRARTKAVVVSGHMGTGREAFVWECIRRRKNTIAYEPYTVSMAENGNIEMLILQLNSIFHHFQEDELKSRLQEDKRSKVQSAVKLLNGLLVHDDYLVIYDDSHSCIRSDRRPADWFQEIASCPDLDEEMRIYVISPVSVNYNRTRIDEGIAYLTLYDLSYSDRRKFIYNYLSSHKISLREEEVNFILESSIYSPNALIKLLGDLCDRNKGETYVHSHLEDYQQIGDKKIRPLILHYKQASSESWNLLVLLSKIEFVSERMLSFIYRDNIDLAKKCLESFVSDGLVECFGSWLEYYRLDSSIGDNMRRNKDIYLDSSMACAVEESLSQMITENAKITEDYSAYLYRIKQDVEKGKKTQDYYLLPSIVLSTIIRAYENKEWEQTISLCERVLRERPHYFEEVYREIHYWYCLALARKKDTSLFNEDVEYFKGTVDYFFLRGFSLRIQRQYARAESQFRIALKMNPSFSRAKRELVNVLQRQRKFSEALELARENYERDRDNSYHFLAYFRCLVRKPGLTAQEQKELKDMIGRAKEIFHSAYFYDGMCFEYDRFIKRDEPETLLLKSNVLEKKSENAPYIKEIISEYHASLGISTTMELLDLDSEIDE